MIVWSILFALLIAPAIANPIAQDRDRRLKICPQAINCLYKYGGEPFVTSFCSTDRITKTERVYDSNTEFDLKHLLTRTQDFLQNYSD